jgi:hypothetical protein
LFSPLKIAVFWVEVPGTFVEVYDVSEVGAASIIRAISVPNNGGSKRL